MTVFDTLVAGFYRAAAGAIGWNAALDAMRAAFGVPSVILWLVDSQTSIVSAVRVGNAAIKDYVVEPIYGADRSEFVASATRLESQLDSPVVMLCGLFVVLDRPRHSLTSTERECACRLAIYLRDALDNYRRSRSILLRAIAAAPLLNSFAYPMWLIDDTASIQFTNQAALIISARTDCVVARGGQFCLVRDRNQQRLLRLLREICGGKGAEKAIIELGGASAGGLAWLHLSLMKPDAFGFIGERRHLLAVLFDSTYTSQLDSQALASMFKLTPAEARVAARLADGMTPEQVAAHHGVALTTVRSQIRQVLAKLGAQRVADVVRILRQGEVLWAGSNVC